MLNMKLLSAINTVLVLVKITLAAPTVQASRYDLQHAFDVDFSTNANGGCGGSNQQKGIEAAYAEAIQTILNTIGSLDWLAKVRNKPKDPNALARFLKITEVFKPLFGDDAWTQDQGLSLTGKAVRDVYESYLEHHQRSASSTTKPNYFLRCDDSWFDYLEPTEKDPREEGQPDAAQYTLAKPRQGLDAFPHGALYAKEGICPGLPHGNSLIHVDTRPAQKQTPYCDKKKKTKAVSNRPNALLILCGRATMPRPGKPPTFEPAEHVNAGTELDNVSDKALATTWIHEMGHYVKGWPEPKVEEGGQSYDVYYWDLTTALAKTNKAKSLQAPEAFALFATAMHYDQWYWGTGTAKSKPSGYEQTPSPSTSKPELNSDPFAVGM